MSPVPLTPSDPRRLGGYWLARRLGAGGQGVVYEAYGESGRRVAVKVPRLSDAASRARLSKEAAAAQRVSSFCTARVIEVRTDVAEPYIVSEYVPGPTLRQVVAEAGPYEGDALRRLAIGVATALTAIHEVGVVHRDLKPDNIILGPDGPRVIDFGVAREIGPLTTTGPIMGTPNYMAPEVFAGSGVAAAADMWAWALVVLFAALGRDPIPAQEPLSVVNAVLDFRPDPGVLPEPLGGLVAAATSRNPDERPSARAILLGLLDVRDDDRLLVEGGNVAAAVRAPLPAEPDLGTIAEELFGELSDGERTLAPDLFLRMVGLTEEDDETVRHVTRDELEATGPVESLLSLYVAASLITEVDSAYTLASPALMQAWPRLRHWVADNREGLHLHRRLTAAARFWDEHGRKPADLLHGSGLDRTLSWAATERRDITLQALEREFLDVSAKQAKRQSKRRGLIAGTLVVLLVATLGGLGLAEHLREVSNGQRDEATARSLLVRAADLRRRDPRLAMRLSVAAWRLSPSIPQSRGGLYDSLSDDGLDSFTDPDVTADTVYATSRDGRTLVSIRAGLVRLWDVREHRKAGEFSGVSPTAVMGALSPGGRILAVQDDREVRLWDVATGTAMGNGFASGASQGNTGRLAFDPAGRFLFVPDLSRSRTGAHWWDLATRRQIRAGSGAGVDAVNADGTLGVVFSTGDGRAELWELKTNRALPADWLPQKKDVQDAVFGENGRTLAVTASVPPPPGQGGVAGHKLLLRRVPSGAALKGDGAGPVGKIYSFGYNERLLAYEGEGSKSLTVLRLTDGQVVLDRELGAPIDQVRFDEPDHVMRVRLMSTVSTMDLRSLHDRPALPGTAGGQALLGPGGRILALYGAGQVRLWDVAGRRSLGQPVEVGEGSLHRPALAFSRDGRRLAIGGMLRTAESSGSHAGVVIVDTSTALPISSFRVANKQADSVAGLAFSPDGTTLAVAPAHWAVDGAMSFPLELWTPASSTVRTVKDVNGSENMAFRPDGKLLVAGFAPEITLVDPLRGARLPRAEGAGSLPTGPYAFSPDGGHVAVSMGSEPLSLWNPDFTGTSGFRFPAVGDGGIYTLAWSPDGRTIATYAAGDRIRLWDVDTRQPLGMIFDGHTDVGFESGATLAFSAEGRTLFSATPDGVVRAHPLDGERAAAAVCDRARGPLSPEEWKRYIHEVEYVNTCD
ncbi:WD40 repeat domain-containing serine/threonine protein kinase [Nonomuraea sp. NPDC052265]|uniref:WD40 repeat domain-containing serine/threonine protein kinase n=1 Tax=Nonomuraea sp. NPDC052265 TaxID=3364374 RepID=UPI0037C72A2D